MWKALWPLVSACFLSGCLTVSAVESRMDLTKDPAVIITEYQDISSDAVGPIKLQRDFDDLHEAWKGDAWPAEQAARGVYIKDRQVTITQSGTIMARSVGYTKRPDRAENFRFTKNQRILVLENMGNGYSILETNGRIVNRQKDLIEIAWPLDAKDLYWKGAYNVPKQAAENKPLLRQMLEAYQASTSTPTHQEGL